MFSLTDLNRIIVDRSTVTDGSSYTASLLQEGAGKCGRKFGEEAIELIIASLSTDDKAVVAEGADVLYHFLVLLKSRGIALDDVLGELENRTSRSGLEEKASRKSKG